MMTFTKSPCTEMNDKFLRFMKTHSKRFLTNCYYDGLGYRAYCENGYGISVVKRVGTRGYECNKWEIAVLKGDELCYDTPITDSVIGWLSDKEVAEYFVAIRNLPSSDEAIREKEWDKIVFEEEQND